MIYLNPNIRTDLSYETKALYQKYYDPDIFILIDLTSNFEAKKYYQENEFDIFDPQQSFDIDRWTIDPQDEMIGMMPMPDPIKLPIIKGQLSLFKSLFRKKGYKQDDFFGVNFRTLKLQDFPCRNWPPNSQGPIDNLAHAYRNGFFEGYQSKLAAFNNQTDITADLLQNVIENSHLGADFTDTRISTYWLEMGKKQGQLYFIWQQILEYSPKKSGLPDEISLDSEIVAPVSESSKTMEIINDKFEAMGSKGSYGWVYAFWNERDYRKFAEILEKFFKKHNYELPTETIHTRPRCKTQLALTLHAIYNELGETLKSDHNFFSIVRVLDVFKHENDDLLYRTLTK